MALTVTFVSVLSSVFFADDVEALVRRYVPQAAYRMTGGATYALNNPVAA